MELLGNIVAGTSLIGLVIQDLSSRRVSLFLLLLLGLGFLISGFEEGFNLKHLLFNIGFIILQLCALSIWSWIRMGSPFAFINKALGLGDVIFFLILGLFFSPTNFVLLYTGALLFSLLTFLIWALIKKKPLSKTEFPLISGMGSFLLIVLVIQQTLTLEP